MATLRSETGYSLLEVVISAALGTIVLAGAFDVYVSSTKSLVRQANSVQMQADTKAAMDYMVREVRRAVTAYTPLSSAITAPNAITFARAAESGYATSGTLTTLSDTSRSWTVNKFAGGTYFVWIKTGAGGGENHAIQSNTATTLTLAAGQTWGVIPNTTSLYFIYRMKTFKLVTNGTLQSLQYSNGGTYQLLAQNVTRLMFSAVAACDAAGTTVVPAGPSASR